MLGRSVNIDNRFTFKSWEQRCHPAQTNLKYKLSCLICERNTLPCIIALSAVFIYVLQGLTLQITPWLKSIRPGVRPGNTADINTMTWSASVTTCKMTKWLKREITEAFGLDSCMMNGSGRTKAALHSENGLAQNNAVAQYSLITVWIQKCEDMTVYILYASFVPEVSKIKLNQLNYLLLMLHLIWKPMIKWDSHYATLNCWVNY